MTSHSKTLLSIRPTLMPGISLSVCMCFSWRPSRPAAAEVEAILETASDVCLRCNSGFVCAGREVAMAVCAMRWAELSCGPDGGGGGGGSSGRWAVTCGTRRRQGESHTRWRGRGSAAGRRKKSSLRSVEASGRESMRRDAGTCISDGPWTSGPALVLARPAFPAPEEPGMNADQRVISLKANAFSFLLCRQHSSAFCVAPCLLQCSRRAPALGCTVPIRGSLSGVVWTPCRPACMRVAIAE